jgi:hypothetical protein
MRSVKLGSNSLQIVVGHRAITSQKKARGQTADDTDDTDFFPTSTLQLGHCPCEYLIREIRVIRGSDATSLSFRFGPVLFGHPALPRKGLCSPERIYLKHPAYRATTWTMPTIVDVTDQELADLKAFTRETDASAALRLAMTEYLRFARRQQLKTLSGQVTMDDNWQSLESAELEASHEQSGAGPD